ncbi:MAG TPA: lipid A biosynthesis acyltransferase [bacterium]|nr:lipid A biosynthesis acyltransferase [bacterium]
MTSKPSPKYRALSWFYPRHWPLVLGLGVLRLGASLPLAWSQRVGRSLGVLAYHVLPSRRRIVLRNLELCFPELTHQQRLKLTRENFVATGMGLMEGGMAWWGSTQRLLPITRIVGMEHYLAAHQHGRGVLVLGAHFTAMELGGRIAAMNVPSSTVYKAAKNEFFNAVMLKQRGRHYQALIASDNLRGMLDVLKAGGACWYGADQDFGLEQSVFAPFFNVQTSTLTFASKIAQRTGARVLFCYPERLPDAQGYVLHLLPVETFPSGDLFQDAKLYNSMIEDVVRKFPADYFWLHRRFKTRPQGEENPYS